MQINKDFELLIGESLEKEAADALFSSLDSERNTTSVRLNPFKMPCDGFHESALKLFGENLDGAVKWCESGFYLKQRINFTLDPLLHAGVYYVQDASSMYLQLIAGLIANPYGSDSSMAMHDSRRTMKVLDLCAAPGGKTLHLASLLPDGSLLVSNEAVRKRVAPLMDNVARWGCSNIVVTNNFPSSFTHFKSMFDVIVADVPCSGEGMFRKSEDAVSGWSLENVDECAKRQREIISDVWPSLMEGGLLVYSTCTYNHLENSDNVNFICSSLGASVVDIFSASGCESVNCIPDGLCRTECGGFQFVPGLVRGEGQFFAVLRKNSSGNCTARNCLNGSAKSRAAHNAATACKECNWLDDQYIYREKTVGEASMIKAYPLSVADDIIALENSNLNVAAGGVAVAVRKGKNLIPHADLALCNDFMQQPEIQGVFPSVELTKEEALKFLAKESLAFPDVKTGYILLKYKEKALGFVKNLGSRSNNLLPPWRRILMSIR